MKTIEDYIQFGINNGFNYKIVNFEVWTQEFTLTIITSKNFIEAIAR